MIVSARLISESDAATVPDLVDRTLQNNAFNDQLFSELLGRHHGTLFDARACSERDLGKRLLAELQVSLHAAIGEWLVVAPLRRILSTSIRTQATGIYVVAAEDAAFWKDIAKDSQSALQWNPRTGLTRSDDPRFFGRDPPSSWLVCRTATASFISSSRSMRYLASVMGSGRQFLQECAPYQASRLMQSIELISFIACAMHCYTEAPAQSSDGWGTKVISNASAYARMWMLPSSHCFLYSIEPRCRYTSRGGRAKGAAYSHACISV